MAVRQAELFTPTYDSKGVPNGGSWQALASDNRDRTYHNSAALLPDGRVLVGGHSPIPNGYGKPSTNPGFSNNFRDPSFEIYSPPYMFNGSRPQITGTSVRDSIQYGQQITIATPQASQVKRVVLVRNTAVTHLVDGDQRTIVLPIKKAQGSSLTVDGPPSPEVAPPGPYLLFILTENNKKLVPSTGQQLSVGLSQGQAGPSTHSAARAATPTRAGSASAVTPANARAAAQSVSQALGTRLDTYRGLTPRNLPAPQLAVVVFGALLASMAVVLRKRRQRW
jgi:hypothetical protein